MGKSYVKDCLVDLMPDEIAGPVTIGAINRFLRQIDTNSKEILISPNSRGSISIDFIPDEKDDLDDSLFLHTFRGYKDGTSFKITGGSIRFPGDVRGVSEATFSGTGGSGMKYWVNVPKSGNASINRGSDYPSYIDSSTYALNLPLCYFNDDEALVYRHFGDFMFTWYPFQWISGFAADSVQSLDHTSSGSLIWNTYGECE